MSRADAEGILAYGCDLGSDFGLPTELEARPEWLRHATEPHDVEDTMISRLTRRGPAEVELIAYGEYEGQRRWILTTDYEAGSWITPQPVDITLSVTPGADQLLAAAAAILGLTIPAPGWLLTSRLY